MAFSQRIGTFINSQSPIFFILSKKITIMATFVALRHIVNILNLYTCMILTTETQLGKAITILKGHESMLYEALSVIVGPFFIFAIVKM